MGEEGGCGGGGRGRGGRAVGRIDVGVCYTRGDRSRRWWGWWGRMICIVRTRLLILLLLYLVCFGYLVRGSDDVRLFVALNVIMLSWFDLLLCTDRRHIHRDYWHKGNDLKQGCRCTAAACAAAVLFVTALHVRVPGTT